MHLAIKRDRMATKVTVTVNGATEDDDVEFMQAMDLGDGRTMHVRVMDADGDGNVVEEVVIVKHRHRRAKGHAVRDGGGIRC